MSTAATGTPSASGHAHSDSKTLTFTMYLIALAVIGVIATCIVTMGLGGLILFGVGATWTCLALLVVMTAGG